MKIPIMLLSGVVACACLLRGDGVVQSRLTPGTILTLEFPELPKMQDDLPAACEVSIPKNYDPAKPVPLLVWFGGGKGSHQVSGADGVVDFDRFVVVALPYPGGKLPRIAAQDCDVAKHWDFQQVMLHKVTELISNIDPRVRIVAGTSSGAHLIGSGLSLEWPGFVDFFTFFVLHEGGTAKSNKYPGSQGKRLLVIWGEESTSFKWQLLFNWRIGQAGGNVSYHSVPGAGHGLTPRGKEVIHAWIDERMAEALSQKTSQ